MKKGLSKGKKQGLCLQIQLKKEFEKPEHQEARIDSIKIERIISLRSELDPVREQHGTFSGVNKKATR